MKDGHPWETEALDELRARQRRQLRDIRDDRVTSLERLDASAVVAELDAPMVELFFRRWAERVADGETVSTLLRSWSGSAARATAGAALIELEAQGDEKFPGAPRLIFKGSGTSLVDAADTARDEDLDDSVLQALHEWLYLVAWAEQLSDDGYQDPRLAQLLDAAQLL